MIARTLILVGCLWLAGILPAGAAGALAQAPETDVPIVQRYTLDVAFDPGAATLAGRMEVAWTNTTGETQSSLPFRLYPNADHYGEGGIVLEAVEVDGEPALAEGSDDPTVMRVPFADEAAQEERRTVALDFTTTIPIDSAGSFGLFRGNSADGSWSLVNWYPIVAGWEPGAGWNLDPPVYGVDPTFVTASAWEVSVTHPATHTLVATGEEQVDRRGDRVVTSIVLDPGRELAMSAFPSGGLSASAIRAGGQDVEITLPAAHDVPGMRDALGDAAGEAVPRLADWFDLPLGGELDLTTATLDGVLGVSWTRMIWLDLEQLTADGALQEVERESLVLVVYHELAHQWMGNAIGVDSNDHAWVPEGVANILAVAVVRDADGPDAARRAFAGFVAGPYRAFVNGGQDAVVDAPAGELEAVVHSIVSYGKGGIGFEAIRQRIGDAAFYGALSQVADRYAWGILTPDALLDAFESTSGEELDALWSRWFKETGRTVAEVDAVIAGSGA